MNVATTTTLLYLLELTQKCLYSIERTIIKQPYTPTTIKIYSISLRQTIKNVV